MHSSRATTTLGDDRSDSAGHQPKFPKGDLSDGTSRDMTLELTYI